MRMEVENDMDNFVLTIQDFAKLNDFYSILSLLNEKKNEGKIVLYAGTYSLESAMERFGYYDNAAFYIYTVPDKNGYCIYKNGMGCEIIEDDDIFKRSHRRLYGKKHLSNCHLEENDCRQGVFFEKQKKKKKEFKERLVEDIAEIVFALISFGIGALVFSLFGSDKKVSEIDPDLVILIGMFVALALIIAIGSLISWIEKRKR